MESCLQDILLQGHGKPVDWWAYGVFVFEMIAGYPPFYDEDVTNTYKKILSGRFGFPSHFSVNCRDLVRKLLQASPHQAMAVSMDGLASRLTICLTSHKLSSILI